VETNRPLVRVTNAGITAFIDERGNVRDETKGFEATTRTWNIYKTSRQTFYTKHGDIFVYACLIISTLCFVLCALKNPSAETRTK
jgi:apolipoprotein N-acyltransferase